ncbi:MAG: hypothetical protein LBH74_07825, partial [Nitrososphaerota archaeon]|nr:hypothetical protein [Nitrososphaerota archaeon]
MRKSTIYIVFTLVLLLIVSSVSLAQITSNTGLQDSENIPVIQALDGGYVIYQEQAVCYLQDVSSGVVVSAGSANSVFSAAFSYLSGGGNLTVRRGTYVGTSSFLMDRCN